MAQIAGMYVSFIANICSRPSLTVPVAQWIARWTSNPKVPGSNPGRDANNNFLAVFLQYMYIFWNNAAILFIKSID